MTVTDHDYVTEQICRIVKGSTMLKAGRMGRPHYRNFCLSNDLKSLQWESPNKDKGATQILIENIDSLLKGQKTKVFESNPVSGYEGISFSVTYKEANVLRSLDIVCKDRNEYDMWTVGLDALLNGFDDIDGVQNIMDDIVVMESKINFDLQGNTIHVKDDACDVYTWGASLKGALGHGQEEEELVPQAVNAVLGKDIHMVACGSEHTMAITDRTGEIFSWGSGRGGKLGVGNILDHYMPLQIGALTSVSYIACGDLHSAVITSTGDLYTFGRAGPWLGYTAKGRKQCVPAKVESLSEYTIMKVSCGTQFTIALTSDGELFVFGENKNGQLGLGHNEPQSEPVLMERFGNDRIAQISCGANHVCAVTDMFGEVWAWGANDFGQLGTRDIKNKNVPTLANILDLEKDEKIMDVKCGGQHSIALSSNGRMFTFGDGQFGQLGIHLEQFQTTYRSTPVHVPIPGKVCGIDCGAAHSAAVTESGGLHTWGRGTSGRLGHADHADRLVPTLVESLAYRRVESVCCGANHTAACVIQAWIKDEEVQFCMGCKLPFTVIRRRHHCRKCGGVFCGACTTKKIPILESGHIDPVLVCDHCYSLLINE